MCAQVKDPIFIYRQRVGRAAGVVVQHRNTACTARHGIMKVEQRDSLAASFPRGENDSSFPWGQYSEKQKTRKLKLTWINAYATDQNFSKQAFQCVYDIIKEEALLSVQGNCLPDNTHFKHYELGFQRKTRALSRECNDKHIFFFFYIF